MKRSGRRLFRSLRKAHRLSRRESRICRRLASLYGLDGRGGPETLAAAVFFRPSFWEVFVRDAREGADGLDPAELAGLAAKIFAVEEELPTDW